MKKFIAVLLIVVFAVALCSCGSTSVADGEKYYDGNVPSANKNTNTAVDNAPSDEGEYSQKVIKTQTLSLETLEFEAGVKKILELTELYGGYVSSSEISSKDSIRYSYYSNLRTAYLDVRIPADSLDKFTADVSKDFNVISSRLSTEDVTDAYYNLQAQFDALKAQEARLEELAGKAETYADLLLIEEKLTNVHSQINYVYSRIQYYDKAVDMSYVKIAMYEVVEYEKEGDPTYGERIGEAAGGGWVAFGEFMGDVFVGILWALPFLLVVAAIAVIIIIVLKKKQGQKQE